VPRLTEADARRLAGRLEASTPDVRSHRVNADPERERKDAAAIAERLKVLFADGKASDELGRALTLDLASYLNRPVRCSITRAVLRASNVWRLEAPGPGFTWWLELDVDLAVAFADAMIGGDGTGRVGQGRRVRRLVELVVLRMLRSIAAAAGVNPPTSAAYAAIPAAVSDAVVMAAGLCAVAADQHGWQFGIRNESPAPVQDEAARETPRLLESITSPTLPDLKSVGANEPQVPIDPDAVVRAAIDAFHRHLQEALHCKVAASAPEISRLGGTELHELPTTSLGLALTAGGNGAIVAFLDGEAVNGLAAGAVGASVSLAAVPGDVVSSAAEAVVRDALSEVARRLPGIASDVHRIVRLSDNPLPARTPHHAVDFRFSVGGRTGTLQLLVPSWMLAPPGIAHVQRDGDEPAGS
jgi:hypothetical protein